MCSSDLVVDSNGDYGDEKEDFHICGSESSGIVWAVGSDVTEFQVGDEVCIGGAQFDEACPLIANGVDPCFSPTYRIWGYEGNWGAFAQFSRAHVQQCFKKPVYRLVSADTIEEKVMDLKEKKAELFDRVVEGAGAADEAAGAGMSRARLTAQEIRELVGG